MAELFDPVNPDSWRRLKPDSTVTLRDEQTIQEMLEQGDGDLSQGRDYFVKSVITIREMNEAAEWILFELDAPRDDDSIWLVVKVADKDLALSVYFAAEEFEPGNRKELIDREFFWLFEEPGNPDDFRFVELAYASRLRLPVMVGEEEREAEFRKLGGMEFHGKVEFTPPREGMSGMMATVAEYDTSENVPNPRLLVFEIGRPDNEYGGNVTFLQGANIRTSEVDVLPMG